MDIICLYGPRFQRIFLTNSEQMLHECYISPQLMVIYGLSIVWTAKEWQLSYYLLVNSSTN